MRPTRVLLPCLLLAACGPSRTEIPAAERQRVLTSIQTGDGSDLQVESWADASIVTTELPADPAAAWTALQAVLVELELPVNLVDPATRTTGLRDVRARRLADRRLSTFLDCGRGLAGQYADQYDVYVTLLAQVQDGEGEGARLRTRLEASARSQAHSGPRVRCTSNRRLERQIGEAVLARVGAPS